MVTKNEKLLYAYRAGSAACKTCSVKGKCIPDQTAYKIIFRWEYEEIVEAHTKKIVLKESFGEEEKESFFKILLDDKIVIDEKGQRIKTLRKKAYKKLFYYLIDLDENIDTIAIIEEAYRMVEELENIT